MARTAKQVGPDRNEFITAIKEILPEESAIYLIFRSNTTGAGNHIVSCFYATLDSFGVPVIKNIDHEVSNILGYKLKDNGEGIVLMGHSDTVAHMLVSSLSYAVWEDYTKYTAKKL